MSGMQSFLSGAVKIWMEVGDLCGAPIDGGIDRQRILDTGEPGDRHPPRREGRAKPSRRRNEQSEAVDGARSPDEVHEDIVDRLGKLAAFFT